MNENKRFVNIGNEIHLNGEWWCSANGEHCADVITTALNELLEENQQYQKWLDALREELSLADRDNTALEKENKELKQESYGNLDGLETYKALYLDLHEKYDNLEADFNDLLKENEQIKKELSLLAEFNQKAIL